MTPTVFTARRGQWPSITVCALLSLRALAPSVNARSLSLEDADDSDSALQVRSLSRLLLPCLQLTRLHGLFRDHCLSPVAWRPSITPKLEGMSEYMLD